MRRLAALIPLALAALAPACGPPRPAEGERPELVVYAAASLRDALEALAPAWERERGTRVVFQFGASNDLARQIVAAPRADVFLSAGEREVDLVEQAGLAEPGTRAVVAENRLVVVEPLDEREPARSAFARPFAPRDLAGPALERLSIAHPEAVPAGRYARAWLASQGLWASLEARVLPGVDVRAALAAVESGAAQAGIVYRTDAAISGRVRVLHEVPPEEGPRIAYPAVCVRGRAQLELARDFLAHLCGAEGRAGLARHGFLPPREAALRGSGPAADRRRGAERTSSASTVEVLRVTLRVAAAATACVLLPGIATGWLLARARFRGKSLVETAVALPLVLPPTAIGYLLLELFARDGPLGERALGFDPGVLFTWRGAVIASAVVAFPLVARTARAAFEVVDPRLEAMGRSLGLGPARAFATITLPLASRGLAAAVVLGFARALGEFGATVIVAGNLPGRTRTLALAIFEEIQLGHERRALELVAWTVALAFAVLALAERLLRARERAAGVRA